MFLFFGLFGFDQLKGQVSIRLDRNRKVQNGRIYKVVAGSQQNVSRATLNLANGAVIELAGGIVANVPISVFVGQYDSAAAIGVVQASLVAENRKSI